MRVHACFYFTLIVCLSGYSAQSWKGISETAVEQTAVVPTLIHGTIPTDIDGTLYLHGAGRVKLNDALHYGHWFDGDALATALRFDGNGSLPVFNAKYVETVRFLAQGNETQRFLTNGAWTQATDWYNRVLSTPLDPSNTNLLFFANHLYSLCEGGYPVQLDPHTLHTIDNHYNFNGQLRSFFSAHPKTYFNEQLQSEVLINIGLSIAPPSTAFGLYVYAILDDDRETFLHTQHISLPYNCLVHDFLVTQNYVVIVVSPYVIRSINILKSVLLGLDALANYAEWRPEYGSYVYVLDKYTLELIASSQIRTISFWHWINGFDEAATAASFSSASNIIRGRLVAFPPDKRSELEYRMKNLFKDDTVADITPDLFGGILELEIHFDEHRIIQVQYHNLSTLNSRIQPFELPEINSNFMGAKSSRYAYTNSISANGLFLNSLQKIDFNTNSSTIFSVIDSNIYLTSPLFVAVDHALSEDDGYIICYGYVNAAGQHKSLIYILNATDIESPLAIMQFDFHLPLFFHGSFVKHSCMS